MVQEFNINGGGFLSQYPPISPNPSLSSKGGNNEDEEKWRYLTDNHHELCDLQKCMGKRTNGLFVCQFSNIPGNIYSQYLRYRRRMGAFKTKPCRNFYGANRFCPAGDNCAFYHGVEEKREMPQQLATNMFDEFDALTIGSDPGAGAFELTMANNHGMNMLLPNSNNDYGGYGGASAAAMVFNGNKAEGGGQRHQQAFGNLVIQMTEMYQRMYRQTLLADDFLRIVDQSRQTQQPFKHWLLNINNSPVKTGSSNCFGIGEARQLSAKKKNSGVERWYAAGGRAVGEVVAHNANSWEDGFSATTTEGSRSMSPVFPEFRKGSLFTSRAVGGSGDGAGDEDHLEQKKSQGASAVEFAKSFHPFGESYPLKNLSSAKNGGDHRQE